MKNILKIILGKMIVLPSENGNQLVLLDSLPRLKSSPMRRKVLLAELNHYDFLSAQRNTLASFGLRF